MKNPEYLEHSSRRVWRPIAGLLCGLLIMTSAVFAESQADASIGAQAEQLPTVYSDQWGPAVGSMLPPLAADDQSGNRQTLADLVGRKGLLLVLVRSADW